jgi:hypothetical protein
MRELALGLGAFAVLALLGWVVGAGWVLLPLAVLGGLIAFLNARDWTAFGPLSGDLPTRAPVLADVHPEAPGIDLDDELEDLLVSARDHAVRQIEDGKQVEPFVMWQDAQGNVKVRRVTTSDPELAMARAREAARAIDQSSPRVVIGLAGRVRIDGRRGHAILFEVAERGFRERTLGFAQMYRPKQLVFSGQAQGRLLYLGDAAHTLRFSDR